MKKLNIKKLIMLNTPYVGMALLFTKLGQAYRLSYGSGLSQKLQNIVQGFKDAFSTLLPSFNPLDLCVGISAAAVIRLAVYLKGKNAKKFRKNEEYGSARWGKHEDIEPYIDQTFENNIILTQTELLTMNNRPKDPKTARNKNVLIIGGSGSGKTRFWLKPNLMQCQSEKYPCSFVVTDPKGTVLIECGNMLRHYGYRIKIMNTINFKKSIVIIIDYQSRYCCNYGDKIGIITDAKRLYDEIKSLSDAHIMWFSFDKYSSQSKSYLGHIYINDIDPINDEMSQHLYPTDTFIDFDYLLAEIGIKVSFDTKNKYRWNSPYSKELINEICKEIYKQYLIHSGITKKCLVSDCDNVLWGGVISEDGIAGIRLSNSGIGQPYYDFQCFLLELYQHGVILAICSKNDYSDVIKVFKEHSGMVLHEEHIAYFQMNWDDKPTNIIKISEALNIGLDSIVFVDDSDFEVASVKELLPDVTAIKFDSSSIYNQLSCFNLKRNVDFNTIVERNITYSTNVLRSQLKDSCVSFDDYLKSLNMNIDIHKSLSSELSRISELSQRTNKCTNGKRYTLEQLKVLHSDNNYHLYSVYLLDRFSDLGLIGAFGIIMDTIDLFSLSCRALGRNIEDKMIEFICTLGAFKVDYKSTGKNEDIHIKLLERLQPLDT